MSAPLATPLLFCFPPSWTDEKGGREGGNEKSVELFSVQPELRKEEEVCTQHKKNFPPAKFDDDVYYVIHFISGFSNFKILSESRSYL